MFWVSLAGLGFDVQCRLGIRPCFASIDTHVFERWLVESEPPPPFSGIFNFAMLYGYMKVMRSGGVQPLSISSTISVFSRPVFLLLVIQVTHSISGTARPECYVLSVAAIKFLNLS